MKKIFHAVFTTVGTFGLNPFTVKPRRLAAVFLIWALTFAGCTKALPPHVVKGPDGKPRPEAGYTFINEAETLNVRWTPGLADPANANVSSSVTEGAWHPDPGYSWATTNEEDRRVVWVPGSSHPDHPHIFSSRQQDYWHAEAGYKFAVADDPFGGVVWTPGLAHPDHPHIFSARRQDYWFPEAGYRFAVPTDPMGGVVWNPGSRHPLYPHITAANRETYWVADSGYRFVSSDGLRVVWSGDTEDQNEKVASAVMKGLGALLADHFAQPDATDGTAAQFGRAVAGQIRDELIDSTIQDVSDLIKK